MVSNIIASAAVAASLLLGAPGTANGPDTDPTMNIVETAVSAGSFNTLVAAVKAAGLVETLSGEGPFTVFAPTDEAFAQIPEDQLNALLADRSADLSRGSRQSHGGGRGQAQLRRDRQWPERGHQGVGWEGHDRQRPGHHC